MFKQQTTCVRFDKSLGPLATDVYIYQPQYDCTSKSGNISSLLTPLANEIHN